MWDSINIQYYIYLLGIVNCFCAIFNVIVVMIIMYNSRDTFQQENVDLDTVFLM